MNNFKQKNKKLESQLLNTMAYSEFDHIKLPYASIANASEMYDADINNVFQQLVDNDLYLKNLFEYNAKYIEGPINYDPDDPKVADLPNGSKIITDDGTQIDILQKIDDELQKSITQQKEEDIQPNWICQFGNKYIVGANGGVYWCNSSEHLSDLTQIANTTKSICYAQTDSYLLVGQENGIACISLSDNYSITSTTGIDKVKYICENQYELSSGEIEKSVYCIAGSSILSGYIDSNLEYQYDELLLSGITGTPSAIAFLQRTASYSKTFDKEIKDNSIVDLSNNMLVATNDKLHRLQTINKNGTFCFRVVNDIDSPKQFISNEKNDFLITSAANKLYRYTLIDKDTEILCQTNDEYATPISNVKLVYTTTGEKYIASSSKTLILSKNLRTWKQFLDISSAYSAATDIVDMLYKNANVVLIATEGGLYETIVSYQLSSCLNQFTADEAYDYLESPVMTSMLSDQLSTAEKHHVDIEHSRDALVTKLNMTYMSPDFSNICAFTSTEEDAQNIISSAANDYIKHIQFISTKGNSDIQIRVNNFATAYKDVAVDCDCIVKLWSSGLNELYINIPTTNTYYISHIQGTPQCDVAPDQLIKRQNLRQLAIQNPLVNDTISCTISSYYTTVKINILSTQYEIAQVLGMQMNGSSLPLNIYRDTDNSDGIAQSYFHSFIEPSQVYDGFDSTKTDNEYYTISACCFGTDAQSFKLSYITPTTRYYDGNMYTVTFYGKNERTLDGSQSYVQKFRIEENEGKPVLESKVLRHNQFEVGNNKYLLGWSTKRQSTTVEYYPDSVLTLADFNGKTNLDLYAIWKDIDWTGCTAFKLNITSNNAIVIAHADKLATAKEIAIDFGD